MNKNQIIVINPVSINIMKAICNSLISNLVEIIIIGNKEIINDLCYKVNININVFRIIHCNNEKEMLFKLKQYQEKVKIDGIIIDELKEHKYKEIIKCEYLCHMIDFGVFKKSVCLLHNSCKVNIINDLTATIEILNMLSIITKKVGIVCYNYEKAVNIRDNIKKNLKIKDVNIVNLDSINQSDYNIIVFENKQLKTSYINKINEYILPKVIEINKASNILIFDAKGKKLKNIFFEFLFFSKLNQLNNEFNTQAI